MSELNVFKLILEAGFVVKAVMFLLMALSVISWGIIFQKIRLIQRSRQRSVDFVDYFWGQSQLEAAYRRTEDLQDCPVASVFRSGFREWSKPSNEPDASHENVERALRRTVTAELTKLETRIPFLATTGSAAPFIGLFGTVWGIMNSFLSIGAKGATSLAVVAPGISEALIATAIGLFAAIPAVIGYNFCVAKIRLIHRDMENFANDFLNLLKRQKQGPSHGPL